MPDALSPACSTFPSGLSECNRRRLPTSQYRIYFYHWLWTWGFTICSCWGAGAARNRSMVCVIKHCSLILLTSRQQEEKCKVTHKENFPCRFEFICTGVGNEFPIRAAGLHGAGQTSAQNANLTFHWNMSWKRGKVGHCTTVCGCLTSAPHEVWHTYIFLIYKQFCYYSKKAQVYWDICGIFVQFWTFIICCFKYFT